MSVSTSLDLMNHNKNTIIFDYASVQGQKSMLEFLASFYSWYKLSMFIIFGVCIIYKYNILGQMI